MRDAGHRMRRRGAAQRGATAARLLDDLAFAQAATRTMSYIDRHLLDGETIVFRTRLHWILFLWPVLLAAALVVLAAFLYANATGARLVAVVPIALASALLLSAYIKRQSSDFAVTNKRVMLKIGVFSTRSIELMLAKIEAIAVDQSLAGRLLDFGDIVVTGSGGTREAFTRIEAPLAFRRAVQSVSDARQGAVQ
jgi:uncharacterized membrane protein YdbT with pleckstrin-like domain